MSDLTKAQKVAVHIMSRDNVEALRKKQFSLADKEEMNKLTAKEKKEVIKIIDRFLEG